MNINVTNELLEPFIGAAEKRGKDASDLIDSFMIQYIVDSAIGEAKKQTKKEELRLWLKDLKNKQLNNS